MISTETKKDIRLINKPELVEIILELGEPKFRANQIYEWLWVKGVTSFDEMTNLSKSLRQSLKAFYEIRTLRTDVTQKSNDGTIKSRYTLHDGHKIEAVLIPVPSDNRYTVCVSTQVGCSLTCKFCATGQMKRERNLDPGEIYDQVKMVNVQCEAHFDRPLTNIVYMGMGEPLLNYKNMMRSVELISSPEGMGLSPKRITVSTAGIAKMIKKLAEDKVKFNLALSLHAATDEKRNEIMPINEQNNLAVLMNSLKEFYNATGTKISYEYITFKGFNDSTEDADALAALCKHFPALVNIIEYNPIDGVSFEKSDSLDIDTFAKRLRSHGIMVTIRRSRGKDIDAACGQLANKN
ncbi:MAG: 23S rRNA (adenine(2503)-C(2))-methyltransferase RlmN [Saprospiraceae bacterium]|nr:23S rRNA (adenine(2503)-C(2))-methyltransferase RlmN [Saprospiraceae bacterium]|tara:strand:- start:5964 stop:7016 length:1053 start_codon:yes stop_codon:yes gene_type:complete